MAYDPCRETVRFVWRKIRFVFAVLDLVEVQNEMGTESSTVEWNRHREERSDAAIQRAVGSPRLLDCFAPLAMTISGSPHATLVASLGSGSQAGQIANDSRATAGRSCAKKQSSG
jgi:hypothetical protein